MEEKIKNIGIYYPASGGNDRNMLDLNIENFMNHKYLIDGNSLKFVQVFINNEPYLRIGCAYHENILKSLLSEFNLKFNTIINKRHSVIPAIKDDNYEFVGAGRIKLKEGCFIFNDFSSDYIDYIKGTDGNHLEAIFGKDKIKTREGEHKEPSYIVNLNNSNIDLEKLMTDESNDGVPF